MGPMSDGGAAPAAATVRRLGRVRRARAVADVVWVVAAIVAGSSVWYAFGDVGSTIVIACAVVVAVALAARALLTRAIWRADAEHAPKPIDRRWLMDWDERAESER